MIMLRVQAVQFASCVVLVRPAMGLWAQLIVQSLDDWIKILLVVVVENQPYQENVNKV